MHQYIALLQSLALHHIPVLHPPWVPTLSSPLDHNEVHLYLLFSIYRVVSLVLRDCKNLHTSAHFRGCSVDRKHSPQNMLGRMCNCLFPSVGAPMEKIINNIQAPPFLLFLSLQKANRIKRKKQKIKKRSVTGT